jgi:hypothetical protein
MEYSFANSEVQPVASVVFIMLLVMTIKTCHIKASHITSAACTTHVLSISYQKVPDGKVLNMLSAIMR